jgi:phytoene dehydrogenase-like protein
MLATWDLEKEFSLTQGNIVQGELTLDQLFFMRPAVGWAQLFLLLERLPHDLNSGPF